MFLLLLLLIVLGCGCEAHAEAVVLRTEKCSSVWFSDDGEFAYGLTASHCASRVGDQVLVFGEGRFWSRVVAVDAVRDVSLLKAYSSQFPSTPSCEFAVLCAGVAIDRGFPGGSYSEAELLVGDVSVAPSVPSGTAPKRVCTVVSGRTGGGSSGGGVFQGGCLVAIHTHGCAAESCHALISVLVDEPVSDASGKCVDGRCGLIDRVVDRQVTRFKESWLPSSGELVAALLGGGGGFYFGGRRAESLLGGSGRRPRATRRSR